jgi:hypothetical protein
MGINIDGYPNLDRTRKEQNCQKGIDACRKLKIETYISAKELSDPEVEPIAVMATLAQFKYIKKLKTPNERVKLIIEDDTNYIFVGKQVRVKDINII